MEGAGNNKYLESGVVSAERLLGEEPGEESPSQAPPCGACSVPVSLANGEAGPQKPAHLLATATQSRVSVEGDASLSWIMPVLSGPEKPNGNHVTVYSRA